MTWLRRLLLRWFGHRYLSTACRHECHDYCAAPTVSRDGTWQTIGPSYSSRRDEPKKPAECKFCVARCICGCHRGKRLGDRRALLPRHLPAQAH